MSSNSVALVFLSVVAAACTTAQTQAPVLTHAGLPHGCPLGVRGATVVAEDTADGIALSFTSRDKSDEMRKRANDAAAQHGPGEHVGGGHEGRHGQGGDHGLQMLQSPTARSIAEDIDNGARIRFVPADPAEKELLRAKLRGRADAMNAGSCE